MGGNVFNNVYPYGTSGICPGTDPLSQRVEANKRKPITAWTEDYPGYRSIIHYFEIYDGAADVRLEQLLYQMDMGKGFINLQLPFGIKIPGDGLCNDYSDQKYYVDDYWGEGTSFQTSHFMTAVALSYYNLDSNGPPVSTALYQQLLTTSGIESDQMGVALRLIIGHEKVSDTKFGGGPRQFLAYIPQYNATTDQDIDMFISAMTADLSGDKSTRDALLRQIMGLGDNQYAEEHRTGNSLEDMRLSLKGVEFGGMIRTGKIKTSQEAADWLRTLAE